jgi:type II secretory pathway pseudopilin PulG
MRWPSGKRPPPVPNPRDAGTSLVEVLVAIGLFGLLGTILLSLALSTANVTENTRQIASVGEESRLAVERMTRELRQATRLKDVHLPASPNDQTRFTLWADFNGTKCIDALSVDPEVLTYIWDPTSQKLTLTATVPDASGHPETLTELVLAAKVTTFTLDLNSSAWQYDENQDGTTTWQEINESSIGDSNGANFTEAELERIDLVRLSVTATDGDHAVTISSRVNLRNQNQDYEMLPCTP